MLAVAQLLIVSGKGRPKQIFLRRATSTIYYALFHALAHCCADMLIGIRGKATSKHAWLETYRSLDHGFASAQCANKTIINKFPSGIIDFATAFSQMKSQRHAADYDPFAKFFKSECGTNLDVARRAIEALDTESDKDRRAFASFVLHKSRKT